MSTKENKELEVPACFEYADLEHFAGGDPEARRKINAMVDAINRIQNTLYAPIVTDIPEKEE